MSSSSPSSKSEPSIGTLVSTASRDLSALVRAEIELAKTELRADMKSAARAGILFAVAAVFGLFLLIMLLFALAEGLVALGLFRWAAYLAVAAILLALAGIVAVGGLRSVKQVKPPARTIETTRETIAWAKHPTKSPAGAESDGQRAPAAK